MLDCAVSVMLWSNLFKDIAYCLVFDDNGLQCYVILTAPTGRIKTPNESYLHLSPLNFHFLALISRIILLFYSYLKIILGIYNGNI